MDGRSRTHGGPARRLEGGRDLQHTDIFATAEEVAELKRLAGEASRTPVIALSVADGLAGNDFAATAWRRARQACHKAALDHGLPEFDGFYGIMLDTGEFVRPD